LWARSRVDHLLEEMALNGMTDELVNETKTLGIAYHLLTPYTAFLAVPESELDATGRELLDAMRLQRDEALALNPDAAALAGEAVPLDAAQASDGASPRDASAPLAAPEGASWGGRGGCASCTVGSRPTHVDMLTWWVLAAVLWRRGRRARR
jgi:hypothetical protein